MNQRSYWLIGFLVVMTALVFWFFQAKEPERVDFSPAAVNPGDLGAASSQAPGSLTRDPALTAPSPRMANDPTFKGVLLELPEGKLISGPGVVELSILDAAGMPHIIRGDLAEGGFEMPAPLFHELSGALIRNWTMLYSGPGIGASQAIEYSTRTIGGNQELCFYLPAARVIQALVTNVRGDAIEGARIDLDPTGGWIQRGPSQITTDSKGQAQFTTYSVGEALGFRVTCSGYSTREDQLAGESSVIKVALKRIFATCYVQSIRHVFSVQELTTFDGPMGYAFRDEDISELRAKHEADNPISADEYYVWSYYGESQWVDKATTQFDFAGWFGGYYGSMTLDLQPLNKDPFHIARIPLEITEQAPALHEVRFHLTRSEQFLATPPTRLQLLVHSMSSDHSLSIPFSDTSKGEFRLSPRRMSGNTYQAFLPRGEFAILPHGADWKNGLPYRDPGVLPGTQFAVSGSPNPTDVELPLAPDEAFVRQRFTNPFGQALDLAAILLPDKSVSSDYIPGYRPMTGQPIMERFVRPGEYYVFVSHPAQWGSVKYPVPFSWSGNQQSAGMWDIPIDLSLLNSLLEQR